MQARLTQTWAPQTQPGRDPQPLATHTHMGKHSRQSMTLSIPILVSFWQTPRRAQHPPDPACTCRDGVEAQGKGWSVPQLHGHIDVGQRGTQDDGR